MIDDITAIVDPLAPLPPIPPIQAPTFTVMPVNVGQLADLCDYDSGRFHLACVEVRVEGETYAVTSTNGKSLARVTGESDASKFPRFPSATLDTPPPAKALIPGNQWKSLLVPKSKKRTRLALRLGVAACDGAFDVSSLPGASSMAQPVVFDAEAGKFPNVEAVIPTTPPVTAICVSAKRLAELLTVAAAFSDNDWDTPVTLEIHANLVVVKTTNPTQQFLGLLMPITPAATPPKKETV